MKASKNFVFIGRSGSGKGTQCELLAKRFDNIWYISTGELFRKLAKANTVTSRKMEAILKEGGLPLDDLATTLWMHDIAFNVKEGQRFILDGAPRRLVEAQNLDRFLDFLGWRESTHYLLIDISREEAYKRMMKRGRVDDTPEAINSRLDYFDKIVTETIEYYRSQKRLITINGEQSIEDVHQEILKATQ